MPTVTVSSKFQVTIPKNVRDLLNIQAGQKLRVRIQEKYFILLPEQSINAARGFLQGMDTHIQPENDRV